MASLEEIRVWLEACIPVNAFVNQVHRQVAIFFLNELSFELSTKPVVGNPAPHFSGLPWVYDDDSLQATEAHAPIPRVLHISSIVLRPYYNCSLAAVSNVWFPLSECVSESELSRA